MDIFTEQIIKRKRSTTDIAISIGASLAVFILIFISFFFLLPMTMIPLIPIAVTAAAIYGGYWVITSRNLEFEYSVTNGDLTVDKIINKRRRKRLLSFDVKEAEEMGKYDPRRMEQRPVDQRIMATETETGEDAWYILARTPKYGRTMLVFNPNENVLDGIKAGMTRQMRLNVFGRS